MTGKRWLTRLTAVLALATLAAVLPVADTVAETPEEITWDDLIPPSDPIPDPFDGLPIDDKIELGMIADVRYQLEQGFIDESASDVAYARELEAKLLDKGLDVEGLLAADRAFMKRVRAEGRKVVTALDGRVVRMPGYALPLEFTEKAVTRFLLVPYVGACIHSPPPPPNQLVVVDLAEPYEVDNIFEPIWITGRIAAKASTEALFFVDGTADIDTGYTLQGLNITPYEGQ